MIPKGRRSDKKSETSDGEKKQLRAVWGSVNWFQRETRPDVSALASLGMGSINRSAVQDLCDANTAVERLKAEPYLGIKLRHISLHMVQDASGANAVEDMSEALAEVEWIRGLFEELTISVSTSSNGKPSLGAAVSWWLHVHQTL